MTEKMDHTVERFGKELGGVRTGRASVGLLDGITIDYYGTQTALNQVANVSTPDALTIAIQPWEQNLVSAVERAIMASDLGLTPSSDGKTIRLPIPPLTEERRKDLVKHVKKMGEEMKVALRNIRRDGNEKIKKLEKAKDISEDDSRHGADEVQKILDTHIAKIDKKIEAKDKEIMDR
jgi:ribosome recycling factor